MVNEMDSVPAIWWTLAVGVIAAGWIVSVAPAARAADKPTGTVCTYKDPDFGVHTHRLDIDQARVNGLRGDGEIVFSMTFSEPFELERNMGFQVAIDADSSRDTGDEDGDEYVLVYVAGAGATPVLNVWTGGYSEPKLNTSLRFSHDRQSVTFKIDGDDLASRINGQLVANPLAFSLWMVAGTGWKTDDSDLDRAPEREHVLMAADSGKWTYPACGFTADASDDSGFGISRNDVYVGLGLLLLGIPVALVGYLNERRQRRRAEELPPAP